MKQKIIILLIYTGLLLSCSSNKKKSTTFSKNSKKHTHNSASRGAPGTQKASGTTQPDKAKAGINSSPEKPDPDRPNNSAMGPGTGGSYASFYYRNKNMKKKSGTTLDQKTQTYQNNLQADSSSIKIDSMDYVNNSW